MPLKCSNNALCFGLTKMLKTSKHDVQNLTCEVSNYHLLVFSPANNLEIACFTVKRSFNRLNSMPKDNMSKDESPVHVTLKAGVKERVHRRS